MKTIRKALLEQIEGIATAIDKTAVKNKVTEILNKAVDEPCIKAEYEQTLLGTRHIFTYERQYIVPSMHDSLIDMFKEKRLADFPFEQLINYLMLTFAFANRDIMLQALYGLRTKLLLLNQDCTVAQYLNVADINKTNQLLKVLGVDDNNNLVVTNSYMPTAPLWCMPVEKYFDYFISIETEQTFTCITGTELQIGDEDFIDYDTTKLPRIPGTYKEYTGYLGRTDLIKQVLRNRNALPLCACTVYELLMTEFVEALEALETKLTKDNFKEVMYEGYSTLAFYMEVMNILEYKMPEVNVLRSIREKQYGTEYQLSDFRHFNSGFVVELCSFDNIKEALYADVSWDAPLAEEWTYVGTLLKLENFKERACSLLDDLKQTKEFIIKVMSLTAEEKYTFIADKVKELKRTTDRTNYKHNLMLYACRELRAEFLEKEYPQLML